MDCGRGRVRQAAPLTVSFVAAVGAGIALAVLLGCAREAPASKARFHFVDVAPVSRIDREVFAGRPDKDHLLDSIGTGCAFLDYDSDGLLDVYIVNAWRLEGDRVVERGRSALYRQEADGRFTDVTDVAGVGGLGRWGQGVVAVDYDGDGHVDLFVTNFGANLLYRNRGDGTFEEVAARVGLESPGWNTGAAFFDANGNGRLDVYIAKYIEASLEEVLATKPTQTWRGIMSVAPGPFGYPGEEDRFFVQEADGTFRDATVEAGMVDTVKGFGLGVRASDFDNDGDIDVYVANDSDANYLYRNEGDLVFREVATWTGAAYDRFGSGQASMGIAVGDATGDGWLDLVSTHFMEDYSTFYRALPDGFYEDATIEVGLAEPTRLPLSWGTEFVDLDNDGDLDLVVVNGHIYPQIDDHPETGQTYRQRNQIFENRDGFFVEVTDQAGPGFQQLLSSRGLAVGDFDNDGRIDLLITHLDAPPSLLRNESAAGAWLTVVCEVPLGAGTRVGTRVTVTAGGRTMLRDLDAGASYLSSHDPRLHFGLGEHEVVDRVEVRWPDGTRTVRENVPARQFLTIRKGVEPG